MNLSRATNAQRKAHLDHLTWTARDRGRRASWQFLLTHRDRQTFVRPLLPNEYLEDGSDQFFPAIAIIAQKDDFCLSDAPLITQVGLRGPTSLAEYVREDHGEAFARTLRELARGPLHFPAANFNVFADRIVPLNRSAA